MPLPPEVKTNNTEHENSDSNSATTEAELKLLYDQAVKGLTLKGKYQQAIQPLTQLVESRTQYRYIVEKYRLLARHVLPWIEPT